jgi:hypothetical protein
MKKLTIMLEDVVKMKNLMFLAAIGTCLFRANVASGQGAPSFTIAGTASPSSVIENNASGNITWTIVNTTGQFVYLDLTTVQDDFQGTQSGLWFNTATGLGDKSDTIYEYDSNATPEGGPPTFTAPTGGYIPYTSGSIYGLGVGSAINSIVITMPWVTSGPDDQNNPNSDTTKVWPIFNRCSTSLNADGSLASPVPFNNGGSPLGQVSVTVTDVPEPSTLALVGIGLALVGYVARRRTPKA